ncbi:MAG: hypothetical protein IPL41_00605 [Micropruina sp.]|nr:hypothetical protein [Micropruina sp.]
MALTPVTPVQQRVIDALIAKGRVARVPADLAKAKIFVRQAQDVITDLPHLTKAQNRYNLAYDACHDVGEAVLAAHGYRTLSGPGQHEAIGLFLCAVIDKPPGDQDARRFDQLRRSRNRQRYDARPVSEAEAALAARTAVALLGAALARGLPKA